MGQLDFSTAAAIAVSKYIFKFVIALIDTILYTCLGILNRRAHWLIQVDYKSGTVLDGHPHVIFDAFIKKL